MDLLAEILNIYGENGLEMTHLFFFGNSGIPSLKTRLVAKQRWMLHKFDFELQNFLFM